ncbi:hypothetical protein A6456_37195 [Paraburkholderia tropica]|nr:hypothetical protein A6456_37195 [Paraburkholderia tropica]
MVRRDRASIVEVSLLLQANPELDEVMGGGRHEFDPNICLMRLSVRAMLHMECRISMQTIRRHP